MAFDCQNCFEEYIHLIIASECKILFVQHLKEIIDYCKFEHVIRENCEHTCKGIVYQLLNKHWDKIVVRIANNEAGLIEKIRNNDDFNMINGRDSIGFDWPKLVTDDGVSLVESLKRNRDYWSTLIIENLLRCDACEGSAFHSQTAFSFFYNESTESPPPVHD